MEKTINKIDILSVILKSKLKKEKDKKPKPRLSIDEKLERIREINICTHKF